MLPFENMIADYIKETGNHVMYRVTPIYKGNDLLPSGVHMEGYSVEDSGKGISFNVYCYNVQPGITIDYATGRSSESGFPLPPEAEESTPAEEYKGIYVLNTKSKKIHRADCSYAASISESNRQEFNGDISSLTKDGYTCCGTCLKDALPSD
jgi:DNA-entry nuclease